MACIESPLPIFGVMDVTNARHCPRITPSVADSLGINLALGPLAIVTYLGDVAAEELGIVTGIACPFVCQAYDTFGHSKHYRVGLIGYADAAPALIDPQPVGKESNWRKKIG